MDDTTQLRNRLLTLWHKFDKGEMSATEARVHIGFARVLIETVKVEIAGAHLGQLIPMPIHLDGRPLKIGGGSKRKAS